MRAVSSSGIISTFAGNGCQESLSITDVAATAACVSYPRGVFADSMANVFISDNNGVIKRVAKSDGIMSIIAGKIMFWMCDVLQ